MEEKVLIEDEDEVFLNCERRMKMEVKQRRERSGKRESLFSLVTVIVAMPLPLPSI